MSQDNNFQVYNFSNIPQQEYNLNPLYAPWIPPTPNYEPSLSLPPPLSTPNWSSGVPRAPQYSPYGAPAPQQYMSHGSQLIPQENPKMEVPESQGLDPLAVEPSALPTYHYMNQSFLYKDFKSEADRISTTHFNRSVNYEHRFVPADNNVPANYNVDESNFNYREETNEFFICSPQVVNEFYPECSERINYASLPNNNGIVTPYLTVDEVNDGILNAEDQSQGREYSSTLNKRTDNGIFSYENAHFGKSAHPESENQDLITEKSKQEGEKLLPLDLSNKFITIRFESLSPSEIQSIRKSQIIRQRRHRIFDLISLKRVNVDMDLFYGTSRKPESRTAIAGWEQSGKSNPLRNNHYIKFYDTIYPCSSLLVIHDSDILKRLSCLIKNFYMKNILNKEQFSSNINVTNEIQVLLERVFKNYTFLLTGSTLSGLGTETSDVNICVVTSNVRDNCFYNQYDHLLKIEKFLSEYGKVLPWYFKELPKLTCSKSGKPKLHFIWHGEYSNIKTVCITVSTHLSNTQLNYFYTYCDQRFQPLYCAIKQWFKIYKFAGKNDSLFSNYSISLLVISYLQNVHVLPVIQEHEGANLYSNHINQIEVRKSWNYKWSSPNTMSLGELYGNFFRYYETFNFKNLIISIRSRNPVKTRDQKRNPVQKFKVSYIFVEDPFTRVNIITNDNCKLELIKFTNALREEYERLCYNMELFLSRLTEVLYSEF